MIAEKKCLGQGKAISYKGCGKMTPVERRRLGLCPKCYPDFLLSNDAGKVIFNKALLKVMKPRIDLQRAESENKNRITTRNLLVNVKAACHTYIRERDKGLPCISCGILWQSDFQAGHFYKAELYSTLKFDEKNISGQCVNCNCRKDGNESGYRVGIINRYGKEHLEYLDHLAQKEKQITHKWDIEILNEIRKYYKSKLKSLK